MDSELVSSILIIAGVCAAGVVGALVALQIGGPLGALVGVLVGGVVGALAVYVGAAAVNALMNKED